MDRKDLSAGQETQRASLNSLILSNSSLYDYLIRPELLFPNPLDTNNFRSDGIHLINSSYNLLAINIGNNFFSNRYNGINYLNGNIGIGTKNATYPLEVQSKYGSSNTLRLYGQYGNTSDNVQLRFTGQKDGDLWAIGSDLALGGSTGDFEFYNFANTGGTSGVKLTTLPTGNVDIGTMTPNQTLYVQGNITLSNLLGLAVSTLPEPCGTTYNGTIGRNTTGLFYCNNSGQWKFLG